jgi:type II secretory pathway pseudopilin PulG
MGALEPRADAADRSLVRLLRARNQDGFGLIELLMAMTVLNIGILAVVAAFNSGAVAIRRAEKVSTASALADAQMELYRGLQYPSIALDSTKVAAVDNTYKCDAALGASCPNATTSLITTSCGGSPPAQCLPSQNVTGADHHIYRVDTYVVLSSATTTPPTPTNGRPVKIVTIVVRDRLLTAARPLARVTSTFDQSTG